MMRKPISLLFAILGISFSAIGQNAYQSAWQDLNQARVDEAIDHFEAALQDPLNKEKALLCLSWLYSDKGMEDKAVQYFREAFYGASDLYPELYALWFTLGALGDEWKKAPAHLEFLKNLEKDPQNKGKLEAGIRYLLLHHHIMSFDQKNQMAYFAKLNMIDDWQMLGPFDNVMNSGFGKDVGALAHPETGTGFVSKYGARVDWFDPPIGTNDGYIVKDMYFLSSNSLVYAQTFLESPQEREVLLKFGYSGSLRLWLNDSLIYDEPEHRSTQLDYFQFRCTFNKGFNRILVQLGDFNESHPNFSMRLTDLQHNPLVLPLKTAYQPYTKGVARAERIPFFATEALAAKAKEEDANVSFLYKLLLAKAYMRSGELYQAEEILKELYNAQPENYFVLRHMIMLYNQIGDNTNQNKFYALFEERYPLDKNVLSNKIDEYNDKDNLPKLRETIETYLSNYPNRYDELNYELLLASKDNENQKSLELIERLYREFPDHFQAMVKKYDLEKNYYSNPKKANGILEEYLKTQYNYNVINELADNYTAAGEMEKALAILRKGIDLVPNGIEARRRMLNILSRVSRFDEAIAMANELMKSRPSDYEILNDLALLHSFKKDQDKETSLSYYKQALEFFPFSFTTNEEVRELKGQTKALDLVPEDDPIQIIKDYEANFKPSKKQSYDIVYDFATTIIFNSRSHAMVTRYILKLNDEYAIENWQHLTLSPENLMNLYIDEVQTIKKNGQKIDAERNGGEVVFTNLEVGDYIFVSFHQIQVSGGKSAFFVSDKAVFNSHYPCYKTEYNLFAEDGLPLRDSLVNGDLQPAITRMEGFTRYRWSLVNPPLLKEEINAPPFYDLATVLHITLDYTWRDVVEWYSDLSTYQAAPDFTIKKIVAELFDGKNLSKEEKARTLYEFVCKNIQYSSVDFRQSGYIPQKASNVYHSRLGDCKDVSTLFVALARASGLEANLVLINTRDNGQKNVLLPSLDFNHCIVKVYLDSGDRYLELTDPDLPFGQLYNYHQGAAILEIPTQNIPENIGLGYLEKNPGFIAHSIRNTRISINPDSKMEVEKNTFKTGMSAVSVVKTYYYSDEQLRNEEMKRSIASDHNSSVSLKNLSFELLEPRVDSVRYSHSYLVENDVVKLGSLKTFKIPFTDNLIDMEIFEDGERVYEFNYLNYEDTDKYEEELTVTLDDTFSFREIPQNVSASYKGNNYSLEFSKISDKKIKIRRTFVVDRQNISPQEFPAFREFMAKVNDGENTHLLFQ